MKFCWMTFLFLQYRRRLPFLPRFVAGVALFGSWSNYLPIFYASLILDFSSQEVPGNTAACVLRRTETCRPLVLAFCRCLCC